MNYFNLSFLPRLGLALLSGSLPTFLPYSERYFEDLYFAPYAITLALLVLIPFIDAKTYRITRSALLVAAAVANLAFAVWLVDPLGQWLNAYDEADLGILAIVLPIVSSTLIISVVTAIIVPIKITTRYIAIAFVAGSIAGIIFPFLVLEMGVCFFDCSWWHNLYFMAGWMIWHSAIFIAIYSGKKRNSPIHG